MIQSDRMVICAMCPLCKDSEEGYICNAKLYLHPRTGDVSTKPKDGYVRGCDCLLEYKTKEEDERCPAGKW